ncbi:uncharacterized protein LOC111379226 [Olea europaea var. sylvestris]|uniref:uncharacterized protein LOC111379226 n=1 Tax=Olea europaea var. sylvestris TaxID=158386 RepID=UPI000C1CF3C2|nr:uncharacterized protein LOC111379226 [Olea europaea var. sylvestris]
MESEFIALDKAAISRAQNSSYNGKSRHIRRRHNTVRQLLKDGIIAIDYVKSSPVTIFWDIEKCPVPRNVRPKDIVGNIRKGLLSHPTINGPVIVLSIYEDFNTILRQIREGCHMIGIKLVDVPNGRKDVVDKTILVDMFLFALDNHEPSSIILISGNVDFAHALHILGQHGYTIIVMIPSWVKVSSSLKNASSYLWDWCSMTRGKGFVHRDKRAIPHSSEEEKVTCTPGASSEHKELTTHVQTPRGLSDLKGQIVKLLKLLGGKFISI